MQTRRGVIGIVGVIGVVACQAVATSQQQGPPEDQLPRFTPSGQLLPPVGWEAWVMVGSSTGLSYAAAPATMIRGAAPCSSCHATEAAHDQVFTQFYPPLRERLARASAH